MSTDSWSAPVDTTPSPGADQPTPFTISEACLEIDELRRQNGKWLQDYELLAEQVDGLRECKERLRIRVMELEGEIQNLQADLRHSHGENDALRTRLDTANAKAIPGRGW